MISLAIAPIKQFSLLDLELEREGPSYTIDTIHQLKRMRPQEQLHLILGEDQLAGLDRWKNIEELVQLAPPLIGARLGDFFIDISGLSANSLKLLHLGVSKIPLMDISSTEIRERLQQGKYCGHLVPSKVLDYIYQHQLYSSVFK